MRIPPIANKHRGSARSSPSRIAFAAAIAGALTLIAVFGWSGAQTRDELRLAAQKAVRVAELRGTIGHLDEWLTMSAQMAAATGEERWVERYDEAAPKLQAAITEASELATPEVRNALAATTNESHRDLATMERRVFALAAAGDLPAARALIDGPEFAYLEDVYASGMEMFGQELTTLADARAAALNDRAWLEAAGLGLSAVLLASAAIAARDRRRLEHALAHTERVARTDTLTDLPNRRKFYETVETALAGLRAENGSFALLLVDLDRFKAVNDARGHLAGDRLLQLAAARMQARVEPQDLVARLGGDEFALLLPLGNAGQPHACAEPGQVAQSLVAALSEPFTFDEGGPVQVGASVGIALAEPGDTTSDLMQRADAALYRAKADGRGRIRVFEAGMDAEARARARLEGELRQAVAHDEIVPYFQPLVSMATGRLLGVEMLARWPHPDGMMVPPGEFIPLAEDLGLIGPMTARLLQRACRAAADWPSHMTLACNISPLQLREPQLPAMIGRILHQTGFPAERLELEVTESALIGDFTVASALLDQLKDLGVSLALDDFGTGYSSLRNLRAFPFDKLKIDASFVVAMAGDVESRKIVSAVIGLSQSLGLTSVAEGIETEPTAQLLRELGCDVGQGWLFGRPVPADGISALIADAAETERSTLASTLANTLASATP